VSLFFVASGGAAIYWGSLPVGRANLDGTYAEPSFISIRPGEGGEARPCGGVAVNGSHVFWANPFGDVIGRAKLDGTASEYAFITGADNPCGVAVDGAHIYWANYEGEAIGRANLDGSEPTQNFIDEVPQPCGLAVDDNFLYWGSVNSSYVGRASLPSGAKDPPLIQGDTNEFGFCGVAVNRTHIFWGGFGEPIGRANLDGSAPNPAFITGVLNPCGIAVDSRHIYWTEQVGVQDDQIGRASLDGTEVERGIVGGLKDSSCGIAVDDLRLAAPPPRKPSTFQIGEVKRNRRTGIAFLAVGIFGVGEIHATVPGAKARVLPYRGPVSLDPFKRWLKIAARPRLGRASRCIHDALKSQGAVRIELTITFTQPDFDPMVKRKAVTLLRRTDRSDGRGASRAGHGKALARRVVTC
jgi:virginiamycin B lyase